MGAASHILALQKKHEEIDKKIHQELTHAARDDIAIRRLKEQRLYLRDEIERLQGDAGL